jgi:hypothetical protein
VVLGFGKTFQNNLGMVMTYITQLFKKKKKKTFACTDKKKQELSAEARSERVLVWIITIKLILSLSYSQSKARKM